MAGFQSLQQNDLSNKERWDLVASVDGMIYEAVFLTVNNSNTNAKMRRQHEQELLDICTDKVFRGAQLFNPSRGKFTTYASFWLRAAISEWNRRRSKEAEFMGKRIKLKDAANILAKAQKNEPTTWDQIIKHVGNSRTKQILELKFHNGLSFNQIGKAVGISRQRAQQIVAGAVDDLRRQIGSVV